ncbi:IclR family transcriptional regulator [Allosalinactinospora lopnorensis]|uniref:IclR family transcriptional regulator n=1 Tax=Allosalinactinospora lopnorensis TaxID=1352348 RepID=UPI000623E91A|nr:IclR family transcriptional regulator [Allosalinactinospora lopnorensis]
MPGRIQSLERAAAVLHSLAGGPRRLGVAELAASLDLPKPTVHGILNTLRHVGFVEQDEQSGKYRLGAALLHLGNSYLDVHELRTRALTWSDALAARSGESTRIGVWHEGAVLVVHHVFRPDDSFQVLEVGTLLPAHASALGKVLLSCEPGLEPDRARRSFTAHTISDSAGLRAELARVRLQGWAADVEELAEGEVSVAAPIRNGRGAAVGAIGVTGAVERLCECGTPRRDLVGQVRDAARAITRDIS